MSATLFNELRYNYNRRTNEDPSLYPSTITADVGLRGVAQDGTPNINVTGFNSIGPGGQYRLAGPGLQHQIIESASWNSPAAPLSSSGSSPPKRSAGC